MPGRGEAGRCLDWLGPDRPRVLQRQRGRRPLLHRPRGLARPPRLGRQVDDRAPSTSLDDDGEELPVGEEGEVWFETNRTFEYHRDPEKTKGACDPRGWSWLGDVGRVDEDGYLYLTDRASHMIISGGVNIYPREIEDVLVDAPRRRRRRPCIGTPDPDMGEQVTAFVQLAPGASVDRRRADRLVPRAPQPLQVPAGGPLRRRAAAAPDRQAPQAPAAELSAGPQLTVRLPWTGTEGGDHHRAAAAGSAWPSAGCSSADGYDVVLTRPHAAKLAGGRRAAIGARWVGGRQRRPGGLRGGRGRGRARVDLLVHAAGVMAGTFVRKESLETFESVLRTNLTSAFVVAARRAARRCRPAVASCSCRRRSAHAPQPGKSAYSASKAGLNAFAGALAKEVDRDGIAVHVVTTGPVATPMLDDVHFPMRTLAVDDVARAVVWLDTLRRQRGRCPRSSSARSTQGPFAPEPFVPEAARKLGRTELPTASSERSRAVHREPGAVDRPRTSAARF